MIGPIRIDDRMARKLCNLTPLAPFSTNNKSVSKLWLIQVEIRASYNILLARRYFIFDRIVLIDLFAYVLLVTVGVIKFLLELTRDYLRIYH